MKKILLAFDGTHFSEGAFAFARYLNEQEPLLLTGAFLPLTDMANLWSYANNSGGTSFIPLLEAEETEVVQKNIDRFETLCQRSNIEYRVHKDYLDFALPELRKEMRFADLAIIGSESFYENFGAGPNAFLADALHGAECPVLIVPEKFTTPESNILAFDGSPASVYAMKQFSYLFPALNKNQTLLVYARQNNEPIPDEIYIEEWAARHFEDLTLYKLELNPKKYFSDWINEKKNAILVSGAYGRSSFSNIFKKSFAAEVIREHKTPVFIAHR